MHYRMVQSYARDDAAVTLDDADAGPRTYPVPALVEDGDGVRLLLLDDATSRFPADVWVRAHRDGAQVLVVAYQAVAYTYGVQLAERFMETRREHPDGTMEPSSVDGWQSPTPPTFREVVLEAEGLTRDGESAEAAASVGGAGSTLAGTFFNPHSHSEYSALDGLATCREIVAAAVADGQPAVALTDHGTVAGHPDLQKACDEAGIRPVFGMEAYLVEDRHSKEGVDGGKLYWHVCLWALDDEGLRNLWAMSTEGYREGHHYKPRIDWDTLERLGAGVAISTGCLSGPVALALQAGDEIKARARLARMMDLFPDRLYVEVETNHLPEQMKVNQGLVHLAREFELPLLAAADSHYASRDQAHTHRAWLAMNTNKDITEDTGMFGGGQDYHCHTAAEVAEALAYLGEDVVAEAMANTVALAERCTARVAGALRKPVYSRDPDHATAVRRDGERLTEMCREAWGRKVEGKDRSEEEYEARLQRELRLIVDRDLCFPAGTPVTMADGSLRPVEQVAVGDSVASTRMYDMRPTSATVLRARSREVREMLASVKVMGQVHPIEATVEHPFLVAGKGWVEAQHLVPGDEVLVTSPTPDPHQPFDLLSVFERDGREWRQRDSDGRVCLVDRSERRAPRNLMGWMDPKIECGNDLMWLVGLWVAEGHLQPSGTPVSNAGQVGWTLHKDEPAVQRLISVLKRLGLGTPRLYTKATRKNVGHKGVVVMITNHPLAVFLDEVAGHGVRTKRLHPWLLSLPHWAMSSFLEGWVEGDGTAVKATGVGVDTVNATLARQLRSILLRQGHWATMAGYKRQHDGAWSYKVAWYPHRRMKPKGARCVDGRWWVKVESVSSRWHEGLVYNLTVDGDHNYVADGVVVHNCGFYLVTADLVREAKRRGILVGPCRGSGGASLVAYLTDITEVDPVQYDLPFERFLTEERVEMPDFDIDFPSSRREEMTRYLAERWGERHVVRIGSHSRLRVKEAVNRSKKVLEPLVDKGHSDWADYQLYTATVDAAEAPLAGQNISWGDLFEQFGAILDPIRAAHPEVFGLAGEVVGRLRGYGKHASGIVISTDDPLDYLPLRRDDDQGALSTQFDFRQLDELGFLKYDFLTLTTLDEIQDAVDAIEANYGRRVDVYGWREEYEDPEVWDALCAGHTSGVFQFDTHAGTRLIKRLRPRSVPDLADVTTLVRPGPSKAGITDEYVARRDGRSPVTYADPRMEEVTGRTQGLIIYQEQVMAAAMVLAGYGAGEADTKIRKPLGKKLTGEKTEAMGREFVQRAVECGTDREVVEAMWEQLKEFSKYSFGKAHAAGYAILAYWTAWLRVHYPEERLMASLSHAGTDEIPDYVAEARRVAVKILPPDVNASGARWTARRGEVLYGLGSIKGVGEAALAALLAHRPFTSWEDFDERVLSAQGVKVNSGQARMLAAVGAFDSIYPHRRALEQSLRLAADGDDRRCVHKDLGCSNPVTGLPCAFDWAAEVDPPLVSKGRGELKVFSAKPPPAKCTVKCRQYAPPPMLDPATVEPWTAEDLRLNEREHLGFYLSSTPFDRIPAEERARLDSAEDVDTGEEREYVVAAVVDEVRPRDDRTGSRYAFVKLSCETGKLEAVCFASRYRVYRHDLVKDKLILAVLRKTDRGCQLIDLAPA